MKKNYVFIFLFLPLVLSAQYGDKELYVYTRLGIGVNMKNITYTTPLGGLAVDRPVSVSLNLGGGTTTEFGMGFKIINRFILEPSLGYTFLSDNIKNPEESTNYINDYQFNKFSIGLNGVYALEIEDHINIVFFGGSSILIPQNLIIHTSNGYETIYYQSSVGLNAGFGGDYEYNDFVFGFGLRYKSDFYRTTLFQNLPTEFNTLNPDLYDFKAVGIDIQFSLKHLF